MLGAAGYRTKHRFPAGYLIEQRCGEARRLIRIARSRARRCRPARTQAIWWGVYLSQVRALKMEILQLEEAVVGAQTPGQAPVWARDLLQSVIPSYSVDSFKTPPPVV